MTKFCSSRSFLSSSKRHRSSSQACLLSLFIFAVIISYLGGPALAGDDFFRRHPVVQNQGISAPSGASVDVRDGDRAKTEEPRYPPRQNGEQFHGLNGGQQISNVNINGVSNINQGPPHQEVVDLSGQRKTEDHNHQPVQNIQEHGQERNLEEKRRNAESEERKRKMASDQLEKNLPVGENLRRQEALPDQQQVRHEPQRSPETQVKEHQNQQKLRGFQDENRKTAETQEHQQQRQNPQDTRREPAVNEKPDDVGRANSPQVVFIEQSNAGQNYSQGVNNVNTNGVVQNGAGSGSNNSPVLQDSHLNNNLKQEAVVPPGQAVLADNTGTNQFGEGKQNTKHEANSEGGIQNQNSVGGIQNQNSVGGIQNQNNVGGIQNQNTVGGLQNQNSAGGIQNQNTVGGLQNQNSAGGIQNQNTVGGLQNQNSAGGSQNQNSVDGLQNQNSVNNNFNPILGITISPNANVNSVVQNGQNNNLLNANPQNVANNNQWVNTVNQQQHLPQLPQQQQQQPQIGGLNLTWDTEDFSIVFGGYGAAEMKVRRAPHPTTGEPWPMPQYYSKKEGRVYKVSKDLRFVTMDITCDILEEALVRHLQRTLRGAVEDMYDNLQNAEGTNVEDPTLRYSKDEFLKATGITRVEVKVRKPCSKYPTLESDESYDLVVKKRKAYIAANEVWGALRGLETFGQLVWKGTDDVLYIKETVINDYPRFPHRGLLIDTSRHFLFKEVILDILEAMEMNKLNVLHWHIVDDQSFPYESKVFPELSRKGAFHPTYVYSLEDIAEIIEYARFRGIRVMPEFDTPGHTYAWGLSRPELLTQCYTGTTPVKGYLGPIDPSKNSTYRFLQALFEEIIDVFKDQYLHLGGDEVPLGCWQSNPEVVAFAQEVARRPHDPNRQQQQNFGGWSAWSDDIRKLYEYYENRLISIISESGRKKKRAVKYVMWQEVMNNNLQLPNDTIIQVWMGDMGDVMRATSMGYQVLYSTCWYMDHVDYGTKWPKFYSCDPVDTTYGYQIDEKKVLGGEAAFWAEYFSNENLIPLMWPRASAAAERLWSSKDVRNLERAAERLSEHRCRMLKRGINAGEINGPAYCLHASPKRRIFNETVGCKVGNCSHSRSLLHQNIEVFLSERGGSFASCGSVFTPGSGSIFIVVILTLVVGVGLYMAKSSNLFRIKNFKNRYILLVFLLVLLVYFLCITPIWMQAFEFSGSFRKTLQEDNKSESGESRVKAEVNNGVAAS